MNNDTTAPKPTQPKQPSPEGLDDADCSPSVSDTPETDAAINQYTHHLPNWLATEIVGAVARRLERERNQMRDELAFAWKSKFKADDYIQTLKDKISLLENSFINRPVAFGDEKRPNQNQETI